ncbi:MAG: TlpA disulfide reductase family protein [Bacteroidota bacterium]
MKYIFFILGLFTLASCNNNGPQLLTVKGTFTGVAGKKILLAELPFNSPQRLVLDSATLDSSGNFSLNTIQQQEGMYQLFIQDGPGLLLINDTTDIEVYANIDSLGKYKVKHSEASRSIKSLYDRLGGLEQTAGKANEMADSIAKTRTPDSLQAPYLRARDHSNKMVTDFLSAYLGMEKNATALWYGLGVASHFFTKEQWALAVEKAVAKYPRHPGINMMKVSVASAQQQATSGQALLNKKVPDLSLPDTSGKAISVSQFRGRWLLIDFWASWCAPCRTENPNLVAAYKQYRNKNFTILGVSLDKDRAAWVNAIAKDSLTWPQMSDMKEWDSKAVATYGFNALPFNILVDTAGTVIAVNLKGPALQQKLKELLVK